VIALHYQTDHPVEDPKPDPRALQFTLTATDRFGNEVESAFGPDGKTPPAPRLRITSARDGAHQEAFEYG
jgi:hypothetical protein